ncbi:MAG: flavodoxin [Oscillospiraceae bacterium]|jgi:flavodoxin short chain|nr:flavodoxin [Oscillospiraceae bacterium]
MKKIAVVYWSGTGNTEAMAKAIAEGVKAADAEVSLFTASEFSAGSVPNYDKIAFGCPSMGAEQLEETEFEPMFVSAEGALSGKELALFGSYGWGDGSWMREWQARCEGLGAYLYGGEGLIINETPDEDGLRKCREFGKGFAA